MSPVFGCSPVGMWIIVLQGVDCPILPGLIVQAAIAALMLLLAVRYSRRRRVMKGPEIGSAGPIAPAT
jgi:hypothetical protein